MNTNFLDMIFQFNPNINAVDHFGRSALHMACRNGNYTAVKYLFQKGLSQDSQGDVNMAENGSQLDIN